jgi:hypothetical protein
MILQVKERMNETRKPILIEIYTVITRTENASTTGENKKNLNDVLDVVRGGTKEELKSLRHSEILIMHSRKK